MPFGTAGHRGIKPSYETLRLCQSHKRGAIPKMEMGAQQKETRISIFHYFPWITKIFSMNMKKDLFFKGALLKHIHMFKIIYTYTFIWLKYKDYRLLSVQKSYLRSKHLTFRGLGLRTYRSYPQES